MVNFKCRTQELKVKKCYKQTLSAFVFSVNIENVRVTSPVFEHKHDFSGCRLNARYEMCIVKSTADPVPTAHNKITTSLNYKTTVANKI